MCDKGEFASGRKLGVPPDLFIGATANPFVPPHRDRVANLDQRLEGKRVCIETIQALRQIEGDAGVHVMGHKNEDMLAEIIVESLPGLGPDKNRGMD